MHYDNILGLGLFCLVLTIAGCDNCLCSQAFSESCFCLFPQLVFIAYDTYYPTNQATSTLTITYDRNPGDPVCQPATVIQTLDLQASPGDLLAQLTATDPEGVSVHMTDAWSITPLSFSSVCSSISFSPSSSTSSSSSLSLSSFSSSSSLSSPSSLSSAWSFFFFFCFFFFLLIVSSSSSYSVPSFFFFFCVPQLKSEGHCIGEICASVIVCNVFLSHCS